MYLAPRACALAFPISLSGFPPIFCLPCGGFFGRTGSEKRGFRRLINAPAFFFWGEKRQWAAENRRPIAFEREKRKSVSGLRGGDPASLRLFAV